MIERDALITDSWNASQGRNPAAKYNAKSQILVDPGIRTFKKTPKTMIYTNRVINRINN